MADPKEKYEMDLYRRLKKLLNHNFLVGIKGKISPLLKVNL